MFTAKKTRMMGLHTYTSYSRLIEISRYQNDKLFRISIQQETVEVEVMMVQTGNPIHANCYAPVKSPSTSVF